MEKYPFSIFQEVEVSIFFTSTKNSWDQKVWELLIIFKSSQVLDFMDI